MTDNEYLEALELRMEQLIDAATDINKIIESRGLGNMQFVLDYLDKLNKLSVSF